jgi:Flp pilus assembly protein TadG
MSTRSIVRRKSVAQSLVEFALVGPLFLVLLLGLIEGARLVYAYNTVNHAAQEAGRVAVLPGTASVATVQAKAVDAAEPLTVNGGDVTVNVNDGATAYGARKIGDRLTVSVKYDFVPLVGLVFGTSGIRLTGSTELMVE